ncbi:MAG: DUF4760 domain-containing protein [Nitrososphaerales archaeon]
MNTTGAKRVKLFELTALDFATTLEISAQTLSSIAVVIGAIFVFFQLRQNNKLIRASNDQAQAAANQAKLGTEQMKQTNAIANMDLVMRLYEFANTAEVQSSWLTVLHTNVNSLEDFDKLPKQDQVSFYQIAALFESLGVLVQRQLVAPDIINDTFQTELAWTLLKPFVQGMRNKYGDDASYVAFESLYETVSTLKTSTT